MGVNNHRTMPVQAWVDVDEGVAEDVAWLNTLPGVRTFASCQGTIGEDGPDPYRAQIMAYWPPEHTALILDRFTMGDFGDGWAYLHPKEASHAGPDDPDSR